MVLKTAAAIPSLKNNVAGIGTHYSKVLNIKIIALFALAGLCFFSTGAFGLAAWPVIMISSATAILIVLAIRIDTMMGHPAVVSAINATPPSPSSVNRSQRRSPPLTPVVPSDLQGQSGGAPSTTQASSSFTAGNSTQGAPAASAAKMLPRVGENYFTPHFQEDYALVSLFDRCGIANKPVFKGSIEDQAKEIRNWMSENRKELDEITSIRLSGLHLQIVPSELCCFQNLVSLDLSNNQLTEYVCKNPHLKKLNLSHNRLTNVVFPREASCLTELNLSYNSLTVVFNVNWCFKLCRFDISHNQLTAPPQVESLHFLEWLDLSYNQLETMCETDRSLCFLYLSHNRLTIPPNLQNNKELNALDISNNRLTRPPIVDKNVELHLLYLSDNQLTEPPDVTRNPGLTRLQLSNNRITVMSDVRQNIKLKELDFSHNQLREIGDLSANISLEELKLSYNLLERVNESFTQLRGLHMVDLENNRFTPEYAAWLQGRTRDLSFTMRISIYDEKKRSVSPQTLEELLHGWIVEFERTFPQEHFQHDWTDRLPTDSSCFATSFAPLLRVAEQENLKTYLRRLRDVADYQEGGSDEKKNVILRVDRMLHLACKNAEFREAMLAAIVEGIESCGDRILIIFNDIEVLWQFHQKELHEEEMMALALRAQRYEEVKRYAQELAVERRLHDHIETILYFLIKLRDGLNLPITTRNMLYAGMAGVGDEDLAIAYDKISKITPQELLNRSAIWHAYLEKKQKPKVEEINAGYTDILGEAEAYFDLSDEETKKAFLQSHQMLAAILQDLALEKYNYLNAAMLIGKKRCEAIAALGTDQGNLTEGGKS